MKKQTGTGGFVKPTIPALPTPAKAAGGSATPSTSQTTTVKTAPAAPKAQPKNPTPKPKVTRVKTVTRKVQTPNVTVTTRVRPGATGSGTAALKTPKQPKVVKEDTGTDATIQHESKLKITGKRIVGAAKIVAVILGILIVLAILTGAGRWGYSWWVNHPIVPPTAKITTTTQAVVPVTPVTPVLTTNDTSAQQALAAVQALNAKIDKLSSDIARPVQTPPPPAEAPKISLTGADGSKTEVPVSTASSGHLIVVSGSSNHVNVNIGNVVHHSVIPTKEEYDAGKRAYVRDEPVTQSEPVQAPLVPPTSSYYPQPGPFVYYGGPAVVVGPGAYYGHTPSGLHGPGTFYGQYNYGRGYIKGSFKQKWP